MSYEEENKPKRSTAGQFRNLYCHVCLSDFYFDPPGEAVVIKSPNVIHKKCDS